MSDEELLHLLSNPATQRRGFEMLVNQYSEKLYWQVRRIVFTHDDANDVVQNALVKIWTKLPEFEGRSKLSTWLSRIAINEALDFIRRESRHQDISSDDQPLTVASLMADDYFDGNELEAIFQEAIATLPDVQRTVFTLHYFDEMKYSDMSKILNTTEGGLKASYHLAMKKIQEYVRKRM